MRLLDLDIPKNELGVRVSSACLPDGTVHPPPNYPNPHVELAIATHLPVSGKEGMSASSRNHINILTSDAVVALPGSHGTASEVQLATR